HAAIHSMHAAHIRPPPFPTRRSSDLFCWPSPLHWQRFPADGHRARLTISLSLSALLPHETIDLACRPQAGGPVMSYLGVFMLLSLLVTIHEAGHLLAAKGAGIPVAGFSVGLGPKILSRRWGRTEYSLRALPLGGFVTP